jgi:hypothetical protein
MDSAYLERCFAKDPSIVAREIADEFILVPIRQTSGDLESIYTLNDVAAHIWELLDGRRSVGEIVEAIVAEFEVEPEEAEADLEEFLQQLEHIGAVRAV